MRRTRPLRPAGPSAPARPSRVAWLALLAAVALVVTGCGGSSTPASGGTGSGTGTGGASPAGSGSGSSAPATVVDGVRLTPQGTQLHLGAPARVTWNPDQHTVGVISVAVTKLAKMPISAFSAWRLDRATRESTPYFVHAKVRNLGRSNLSGKAVPLYLLDQGNTLLQASTFQAQFARCPSRPLPQRFTHGKSASVCLVYFVPAHGTLVAISFRPTEAFHAITWNGAISAPRIHKRTHHHKKK